MPIPPPLEGVKVFDATQGVAGPHSTMLLAQYGADVTKLEPLDGDWGRTLGKTYGDQCAHSVVFNRGKKSLAMDMKTESAQKIAFKLASQADVVVESFRPGVMTRFGIGYEQVKAANPQVIYLSVTGFGQEGPYNRLPVTDSVIQAFSGWMSINRDASGAPQRISMVAIDVMTGLYAYQAIASALLRKFRFGEGAYIDCSLMQSAAAFQSAKVIEHYLEGGAPQVLYVPVGTMQTEDGYINVTAMREHHYVSLCKALGRDDLAEDPRYNSREKRIAREAELMPLIRAEFTKRTTAAWADALTEAGVMNAPVSTYDHYLADEHVKAVESISWMEHPGMPGTLPVSNIPGLAKIGTQDALDRAPHIGEHSREILLREGWTLAQVEEFLAVGVVGEMTETTAEAAE
ncbi:MAG: CoA transferase [Alphaproteobacteria bacterium]|nr:CoA transferase [Alphaproteobacteria bacterium]MCY4318978.1 CoA transferase [Alphaproteobacteria bacterium]